MSSRRQMSLQKYMETVHQSRLLQLFIGLLVLVAVAVIGHRMYYNSLIKVPASSTNLQNKPYEIVVNQFEKAGFTTIQLEELKDLDQGTKADWTVDSIRIGNDKSFSRDKRYLPGTEVHITYHSFSHKAIDFSKIKLAGRSLKETKEELNKQGFLDIETIEKRINSGKSSEIGQFIVLINDKAPDAAVHYSNEARVVIEQNVLSPNAFVVSDFQLKGKKTYQEVVEQLKGFGFTNVTAKAKESTESTKHETVSKVTIGGRQYKKIQDMIFAKDAEVIVTYRDASKQIATEKKVQEAREAAEVARKIQETAEKEAQRAREEQERQAKLPLTIENSSDFAAILSSYNTNLAREFVEKNRGKIVEFNGHIAYLALHGNYKTRYDVLIYGGDWVSEAETNYTGISMQFYNVALTSGEFNSLNDIRVGENIHIQARIIEFTKGELLRLEPIQITDR